MLTQTPSSISPRHPAVPRTSRTTPPPQFRAHDLIDQLDLMGAPMRFLRNAEIYGENEPADYVYKVVSGAV